MQVLCHRGYWKTPDETNTVVAFRRAFSLGLGTETDVRDHCGQLVIAHDCPTGSEMPLDDFLQLASEARPLGARLTLALNIKADGLATAVRSALDRFLDLDCFVFDMSVPDMRGYFAAGVPVMTRMSEVERVPAWLQPSIGVWLDAFEDDWYDIETLDQLLKTGKRVTVVSCELHKRDHSNLWNRLKGFRSEPGLSICTDLPEEALAFFEVREV